MKPGSVAARPRVGVVKFASCDGCQLTLLDLEDELLSVVAHFDIIDFPEATSARSAGPYDVLFVEGSVSEPAHLERIADLRKRSRFLVTIGACATAGGIQALRNWGDHDAFRASVYAHPEFIHSLATSTPIAEHVPVDAELRGCPIDPETGCGAICPRFGRGCYGCFGPRERANAAGLARHLQLADDRPREEVGRLFAGFTAYSEPFRTMVTELGGTRQARREGAVEVAPTGGSDARH
jgi:sulfhydrogenase subunit delta